jgi:CBS domain-containing protein
MKTVSQLLEIKGSAILSIPSEATVYEALVIMEANRVGALLVMDEGRLVGIFSERDYARSVALQGKTSKNTLIKEVMTPRSVMTTISRDNTVKECLNLVTNRRIRHLPVMEGETVIGVLSIGDLVKEMIEYQQFLINELMKYIES